MIITYEPSHEKTCFCLDSVKPLVSISKVSSLYLASVAAQAGLSLTWSQTPKLGFLVTKLICIIVRDE